MFLSLNTLNSEKTFRKNYNASVNQGRSQVCCMSISPGLLNKEMLFKKAHLGTKLKIIQETLFVTKENAA